MPMPGTGSPLRYVRSPEQVKALNKPVVVVACGEFHTAVSDLLVGCSDILTDRKYAVYWQPQKALTASGEVYTWGAGKDGQLGQDSRDDIT